MKKNFMIIGDSWGCGEWRYDQKCYIVHRGIAQFLTDDNYFVFNLSQPSGSNMMAAFRAENFLENNPWQHIDRIFVFQTDWLRDHYLFADHRENSFQTLQQAEAYFIAQFYHSLSDIAVRYNVPISLIGGLSDTLMIDRFEYPGLQIICQSFTNFLVTQDHLLEKPIHSIYDNRAEILIDMLPKNNLVKQEILEKFELAKQREKIFKENRVLFPDKAHPSALAHSQLYRFLQSTQPSIFK